VGGRVTPHEARFAACINDKRLVSSAVLALMPDRATFTGTRLDDGSVIGQVALGGLTGAHPRTGRVLAMGWLAALLRTLARQPVVTAQRGENLS